MTIYGSTSTIRNALTSTLLGISAFFLSNDNSAACRTDEALNWRAAANRYRCRTIKLLRDAANNDFHSKSRPKYKDFLATTLSMITMNVISGDTETCGIHLDGAFNLINQARKWKSKYSHKAQSLHRIYFYLRAIFESTAPRLHRASRRFLSSVDTVDVDTDAGSDDQDDVFCQRLLYNQMLGYKSTLDLDLETRISNCERIYGIPHTLLFLLTKVIGLIDKLYDAKEANPTAIIPDHLVDECDDLEKSIMDWPTNACLEQCAAQAISTKSKIIHQHTIAFHNALVIYFAQHVRLVGHRFLLPYVTAVLESMEAIERLKSGTEALAAPLYWPAFIAGSEAFDEGLQARFRCWYEHVEVYRIEALRTGVGVLKEVWETGPSARNRTTSYWREIVERSDVRLMLS
ncbi:hypothetical protein CkaCkLH20_08370 [Colletotrichum karsti]|uniref:Uncharacterized protein n=1 Tax=Colletotrichum karsti TaxID=1095194 RepID=A0A9P6HYM2_9PEZI|nr:uncharacterized protein CkaCkLH20_08370 [Colletotrichum karsti]KAF9873998.1 hypothetical protein CkaCkLH20_08370 [Colletotrichum karsti]